MKLNNSGNTFNMIEKHIRIVAFMRAIPFTLDAIDMHSKPGLLSLITKERQRCKV